MYQQQPQQGGYGAPRSAANPNGGYLKPNQYGLAGAITITPELLANIQATGKVYITVGQVKDGQYGPSARCVAKPVTAVQRPAAPPVQGGQYYPPQAHAVPQYAGAAPQQYAQPQQAPYNPNQPIDDDLPF